MISAGARISSLPVNTETEASYHHVYIINILMLEWKAEKTDISPDPP